MKNVLSLLLGAVFMVVLATATAAQPELPQVSVLVHTAKPYKSVIREIKKLGGTINFAYENVDGLAVQIPADALSALASIEGVGAVEKDMIINLPKPREDFPQVNIFQNAEPVTKGKKRGKKNAAPAAAPAGVEFLDPAAVSELIGSDPEGFYSYLGIATGAADTWAETAAGASSIVAVIDTGTWADHPCLDTSAVIAGPDFSTDGTEFGGPGGPFDGSTIVGNHWHGTFVGGVISNDCAIVDVVGGIFDTHLPAAAKIDIGGGLILIPILGMAPDAVIYAVKVFPFTGAGAANFRISAAIDHVISVKLSGAVDVDVINMSLGGATLFDGRTIQEQLVDAATAAGITVVISSGNEGPSLGSVAAPGTAYTALTVAAGTDPVHTRIFWDLSFGAGEGILLYPDDERGVSDFSNRGPSADNRSAVDIIATGVFNFSGFTPSALAGVLNFASGTSFSAPTVAGAAALLASWRNINSVPVSALGIKNALTDGAVPIASDGWPFHAQGHGWVQVANSLALLKAGKINDGRRNDLSDPLKPNILLGGETEHTETITVKRGRTFDFLVEITEETESVEVIVDLAGPVAPGPSAFFPNSWEIYVKSAKHGGTSSLVDSSNIFDDASVTIGDGTIGFTGAIVGGLVIPAPMEPGIMKVILEPDWTNNASDLTATVTIKRTNGAPTSNAGGITLTVGQDDFNVFAVAVPGGLSTLTFDLSWTHDWSKDATNDLDILVLPPSGPLLVDGATLNAPERQIIEDPVAGVWLFAIDGFTVNKGRDPATVRITFEE